MVRKSSWLPLLSVVIGTISTLGPASADARSILPGPIPHWARIGVVKTFSPANLFDLIDGEAQSVLVYSFVSCAHSEFAPVGQTRPALTMDVFDMSDPLNAFGMFGSDRISGQPVAIGTEGVKIGSSAVNFWKGRYVVRTTIVQVTPANQAADLAFARAAAAKITGASAIPGVLHLLPPGFAARSYTYEKANVAGQSYLKNGVSAKYPTAGQQAVLSIVQFPSPAAATQAFGRLQADSQRGTNVAAGAHPTQLRGVGSSGFEVKTRFQGEVVAAVRGKSLAMVRRAKSAPAAIALVKAALSR